MDELVTPAIPAVNTLRLVLPYSNETQMRAILALFEYSDCQPVDFECASYIYRTQSASTPKIGAVVHENYERIVIVTECPMHTCTYDDDLFKLVGELSQHCKVYQTDCCEEYPERTDLDNLTVIGFPVHDRKPTLAIEQETHKQVQFDLNVDYIPASK